MTLGLTATECGTMDGVTGGSYLPEIHDRADPSIDEDGALEQGAASSTPARKTSSLMVSGVEARMTLMISDRVTIGGITCADGTRSTRVFWA